MTPIFIEQMFSHPDALRQQASFLGGLTAPFFVSMAFTFI